MSELKDLLPLVSTGVLPWSFAVIFLIATVTHGVKTKAKPEITIAVIGSILMIAIIALDHLGPKAANQMTVRTGDIKQQGSANAAGVGGSVSLPSQPCDTDKQVRK